jgi:hypothetical protein
MAEILAVTSERVDDIPLLAARQMRMGLSDLLLGGHLHAVEADFRDLHLKTGEP